MQVSKLYVGNLSYSVTSEQLKELFSNQERAVGCSLAPTLEAVS